MKNTSLIAIALLTRLALTASIQAQEKCKWETMKVAADAERKARLEESMRRSPSLLLRSRLLHPLLLNLD